MVEAARHYRSLFNLVVWIGYRRNGTNPDEAPVIKASRPLISFWEDMVLMGRVARYVDYHGRGKISRLMRYQDAIHFRSKLRDSANCLRGI